MTAWTRRSNSPRLRASGGKRRHAVHPLTGGLLLLLIAGCRGEPPIEVPAELGQVTGQVTLDGEPLAGALVLFLPPGNAVPWRESRALTDEKGRYELIYFKEIKGASLGNHTVKITCPDPRDIERQMLPARYNRQTTLDAEVSRGDNTFDFPLESQP